MIKIENERLEVTINELGAELNNIYHKELNTEYLWGADPAFWAKKSPVLFPIVGALKDNRYFFEGRDYELGRHGFARESMFTVVNQTGTTASFLLTSNERTRAVYPFDFRFNVHYALHGDTIEVSYEVENPSRDMMYFSVGGHPAFRLPLDPSVSYEDYYLHFAFEENAGRWPITATGLLQAQPEPLLQNTRNLPLSKSLFAADALVLKHLASHKVTLQSDKSPRGLVFNFPGFPYLGIWAAKNADFLCIEPWCGIADSEQTTQELTIKEGINKLEGGGSFERTWSVTIF